MKFGEIVGSFVAPVLTQLIFSKFSKQLGTSQFNALQSQTSYLPPQQNAQNSWWQNTIVPAPQVMSPMDSLLAKLRGGTLVHPPIRAPELYVQDATAVLNKSFATKKFEDVAAALKTYGFADNKIVAYPTDKTSTFLPPQQEPGQVIVKYNSALGIVESISLVGPVDPQVVIPGLTNPGGVGDFVKIHDTPEGAKNALLAAGYTEHKEVVGAGPMVGSPPIYRITYTGPGGTFKIEPFSVPSTPGSDALNVRYRIVPYLKVGDFVKVHDTPESARNALLAAGYEEIPIVTGAGPFVGAPVTLLMTYVGPGGTFMIKPVSEQTPPLVDPWKVKYHIVPYLKDGTVPVQPLPQILMQVKGMPVAMAEAQLRDNGYEKARLRIPNGGNLPDGQVGIQGGAGWAYRAPNGEMFTASYDSNGNILDFIKTTVGAVGDDLKLAEVRKSLESEGYSLNEQLGVFERGTERLAIRLALPSDSVRYIAIDPVAAPRRDVVADLQQQLLYSRVSIIDAYEMFKKEGYYQSGAVAGQSISFSHNATDSSVQLLISDSGYVMGVAPIAVASPGPAGQSIPAPQSTPVGMYRDPVTGQWVTSHQSQYYA